MWVQLTSRLLEQKVTGVHDLSFDTDISEQRSFRFQIANCYQAPGKAWLSTVLDMAFSEVNRFRNGPNSVLKLL